MFERNVEALVSTESVIAELVSDKRIVEALVAKVETVVAVSVDVVVSAPIVDNVSELVSKDCVVEPAFVEGITAELVAKEDVEVLSVFTFETVVKLISVLDKSEADVTSALELEFWAFVDMASAKLKFYLKSRNLTIMRKLKNSKDVSNNFKMLITTEFTYLVYFFF